LLLAEGENTIFDVLRSVTNERIPLLKMERAEPSLESLFMEVVEP
jgi:hypothetical protein